MIQLSNISKIYNRDGQKVVALDNVSLTIKKGEFIAILGPSGSGKSTLMNTLGLLDTPEKGTYLLDGKNVKKFDQDELAQIRNQQIGFIFQAFHLLPRTTALENVELPLLYSKKQTEKNRAMKLLSSVGLEDRGKHLPNELSGGQKQRVAIARALINDPDIILADEPTGSLDRESGRGILKLLTQLNKNGRTIIYITHEPEIATYANRIIEIEDGRIKSDSKAEYLMGNC